MAAHPTQIHLREAEESLEFQWSDGTSSTFALRYLRGWCPCAHCQGHFAKEMRFHDVLGVKLLTVEPVGSYAVRPHWSDGHQSGLYSFEYLMRIAGEAPGEGPSNESFFND
jgi:DUF971 family protein